MTEPDEPTNLTLDAIAEAVAKKLEEHDAKREAEAAEAKAASKRKDQLTTRISIAAMALTILMSFLGYVRSERADASSSAKSEAALAHAESEASWTYYEAKNEQRAAYRMADDELTRGVQGLPAGDPRITMATAHHTHYMNEIFEVSNDCRHLFASIQDRNKRRIEKRREAARIDKHVDQYEMATRILTMAIILFSITLLANKPALFWGGVVTAFFGAAVAVNGYFLFV